MGDRYDLVIVGMGSGGMVAAEFAAALRLRVAVVERSRVGGDCLWTGCVPSKALLASAKVAHAMRHADRYGLGPVVPTVDTAAVWSRIRRVQQRIAEGDDSADRYRAMGVDVVFGAAVLSGPTTVTVDGSRRLTARAILVCTGSRPVEPPIDGLGEAGFLTSENVFELERAPASVIMIGGGPIAIEMAQGFNRLGIRTTVLQKGPGILPRDEPELVRVLQKRLVDEGVELCLGVDTQRVTVGPDGKTVHGTRAGEPCSWSAQELLVAVGRRPNIDGLGLEAIGVRTGERGIVVDDRLRTSVDTVYAAGDVAGRNLFTHSAGYEAVRAVRDAFLPGRGRAGALVPWCTFTDPELAHVGLTSVEAAQAHDGRIRVWRHQLAHSDRARADGADEGAIVVVTDRRRRILGAHVLAPAGGELVHELALALNHKLRLEQLASMVHVYPTLATGVAQLAAEAAFEAAARFGWLARLRR